MRRLILGSRLRGATGRQRTAPSRLRRQIVSRLSPSAAVRKMPPPAKTRAEWPEVRGVLHTAASPFPHGTWRSAATTKPDPFGPRNSSQSAAGAAEAVASTASTVRTHTIVARAILACRYAIYGSSPVMFRADAIPREFKRFLRIRGT